MNKTYSVRSSATRAAKKEFGENWADAVNIITNADGSFSYEPKSTAELTEKETGGDPFKAPNIEIQPPAALVAPLIPAAPTLAIPPAPTIAPAIPAEVAQGDAMANTALVAEGNSANPLKPKHSSVERPTKLVWHIADKMCELAAVEGRPVPTRKEVMEECVKQGVAFGTARTQYQHWFKTKNDSAAAPVARIKPDGTIEFPAAPKQ